MDQSTISNEIIFTELNCPHCNSPLQQHLAGSLTLVCPACQSHVCLGTETPSVEAGRKIDKPPVPIQLGDRAQFGSENYVVLGRILYEGWDPEDTDDKWQWNEWLLASSTGQLRWLEHDDEADFILSTKIRLRQAFNVQSDSVIPVGNNRTASVKERYPARVIGAEGELTALIRCDDQLTVIDATSNGQYFSVEANDREIELFEGDRLDKADVLHAFGKVKSTNKSPTKKGGNAVLVAWIFCIFAMVSLVTAVYVSSFGDLIHSETVSLTSETTSAVIPFSIPSGDSPMQVIASLTQPLANNSAADIDVTLQSPNETETLLLDHNYFHESGTETGYDDGEYYSENYDENDYTVETSFIPKQSGNHRLSVSWAPSADIKNLDIKVELYTGRQASGWLVGFGLLTGFIALAIFVAPVIRKKLNLS